MAGPATSPDRTAAMFPNVMARHSGVPLGAGQRRRTPPFRRRFGERSQPVTAAMDLSLKRRRLAPMLKEAQAPSGVDEPALAAAFLAALTGKPKMLSQAQRAFIAGVAQDYRPEELAPVKAADVAQAAAGFWSFVEAFAGPRPAIRMVAPTGADGQPLGADIVEIVQPDAPFLVDSV